MTVPNPFRLAIAAIVAGYARLAGYQVLAEEEIVEHRQAICDPCPFRDGEQCGVCSCFIEAKTRINTEQCPKRFWSRVWVRKSTV